jgi:hypothetical protein
VSGPQPLLIILPRPVRIEILSRIARQLGGIHDRDMPTERQRGTSRPQLPHPQLASAGASRAGYNPSAQAGNNFC